MPSSAQATRLDEHTTRLEDLTYRTDSCDQSIGALGVSVDEGEKAMTTAKR